MNKKVLIFEYETFSARKAKCVESHDLPRKRDRWRKISQLQLRVGIIFYTDCLISHESYF